MNEIEKLNERIAQLTELVKTGSEAIKSMETALKAAEAERDRLADQRRESEPKFEKVEFGERYYGVCVNSEVESRIYNEVGNMRDDAHFRNNNYFHTEERAQEVVSKINLLLRLERLHDTFCPDYVPDWGNCWLPKYYIYQDKSMGNIWICGAVSTDSDIVQVYFPTEDIAQKVCDILNAEERSKDK